MKHKIVIKSLAELPIATFELRDPMLDLSESPVQRSPSGPGRADRPEGHDAAIESAAFIQALMEKSAAPMHLNQPWIRGGLNE